jgi:hypothetical protein
MRMHRLAANESYSILYYGHYDVAITDILLKID